LPLLQVPGGPELLIIGIILLIFVGTFALWVGLAYWVYKDATKRNMDNAAIWGLVTFVLGIFGIVIYLLVRD
jgi:heme/copper-type cytochrome/quinol oxidase subunit 3